MGRSRSRFSRWGLLLLSGSTSFACSASDGGAPIAAAGRAGSVTASAGNANGGAATGGGANGGSANGGAATGGSSSYAGTSGNDANGGAVCADAKSDPELVVAKAALPVRFVLLYDPAQDNPANVPSWTDFTDTCGASATGPHGVTGFAPWGECVARKFVDQTNAAFAQLLGSIAPMLAFASYTATPNAALARGHMAKELPDILQSQIQPGLVNVFVVMAVDDAGGVAQLQQSYPDESLGVLTILAANTDWRGLAHEFGHAIGYPHVSGKSVGFTATYPCCGGLEIATKPGACDPMTSNIMCEGPGPSFDSCADGAFLKKIAACWLSGNGNPGCAQSGTNPDDCNVFDDMPGLPPLADCVNNGSSYTCTCAGSGITYSASTCLAVLEDYDAKCFPTAPTCAPLGANQCDAGNSCYFNFGAENHCLPTGSVPLGSSCSTLNDCVEGAACLATTSSDVKVCGVVCDSTATSTPHQCPAYCQFSADDGKLAICVTDPKIKP